MAKILLNNVATIFLILSFNVGVQIYAAPPPEGYPIPHTEPINSFALPEPYGPAAIKQPPVPEALYAPGSLAPVDVPLMEAPVAPFAQPVELPAVAPARPYPVPSNKPCTCPITHAAPPAVAPMNQIGIPYNEYPNIGGYDGYCNDCGGLRGLNGFND
ncbi:14274_t:CDS:1, partial [Acaulospora morrowiae]